MPKSISQVLTLHNKFFLYSPFIGLISNLPDKKLYKRKYKMKKILALVAASLLSLSSFAENTFHVGAFFPVTILDIDGESVVAETAGAAFDFTHVADCGFTFKAGAGYGFGLSDIEDAKGDNLTWFDLDFSAGFGGSFIHDEKMTLSLLGDIGLRIQGGGESADGNSVDYIPVMFYFGPEVSFTYRFTPHVGLFANLGVFYAIGSTSAEITSAGETFSDDLSTSGFIVQPKLGVAFTL